MNDKDLFINTEGILPINEIEIMNGKEEKKSSPFVKCYFGLTYLFTPAEERFILHMVGIEYLKSCGYNTDWTRAEYMKRMGLNVHSFEHCVKKLMGMNLLSKTHNPQGNRVFYSFNMELYEKLVRILSTTSNVDKLIEFCDTKFKEENRSIESITEEEIVSLKSHSGLKKLHPSMYPAN